MLKTIGILLLLLALGFHSSQGQHNIKGSGYVITQQRETDYFNSIEVSRNISVYIVQGEFQPITVEADNNLFPYIKTIVRERVLKIYIPDTVNIIKYADMNVLISMPRIVKLQARTSSYIDGSPQIWNIDTINLKASSGSRIKLAAHSTNIEVEAKASAIIELKGKTEQLEATLKTAARLYARDLKVDKAQLQLGTAARAEVDVNRQIEYNLCGNARLTLRGNPVVLKSEINSGSRIIHEK